MTVRRVMGIETEYGICHASTLTSEEQSRAMIAAYGRALEDMGYCDDVAWDMAGEVPLTFGSDVAHLLHRPASLTAQERAWQRGTTKMLRNGARFYVDHAHPEYATPECLGPRQAVHYDRAGEIILRRAMAQLETETGLSPALYKNNVDGKGAAYGCHENYLVERQVPFDDLVTALVPFLVTRPVLVGAGRVGLGPASDTPGFQLSQRADYIHELVGPNTTYDRPIVNTRDEPHADPNRFRRLHVINGDANCVPSNTLLKLGMTALVLWVLERDGVPSEWENLALADPIHAVREVSRDLTLSTPLELADGRTMTALEIQQAYQATASRTLHHHYAMIGSRADVETVDILDRWRDTIGLLTTDWRLTIGDVEWATKRALLEARMTRDGLGWDAPEIAAMDVQWADIRTTKSLPHQLMQRGILEALAPDEWLDRAEFVPPASTRAWLRGELIRRFPESVYSASWHSVVLEDADGFVRVPMTSPEDGSEVRMREGLDRCETIADVIEMLGESALTETDMFAKG